MLVVAVAAGIAAVGLSLPIAGYHLLGLVCLALAASMILTASLHFLGKDEQLRLVGFTETIVINGPTTRILYPMTYRSATVNKATSLGNMDYVKVKDTVSGAVRIERGPKLLFLGAYDQITNQGTGITLSQTEYLIVENQETGGSRTVRGPTVFFPAAYESFGAKRTAISLTEDEYICVSDTATGSRLVVKGKNLFFVEPTQKVDDGIRKAWTLQANEYVRLLDTITGKIAVHKGESTVFPSPYDEVLDGDKTCALNLKANEYVKVLDQTNSKIYVAKGPAMFVPGANDKTLDGGKKKAVQIDDEHAVLVRDIATGQLRLVTEKQLFMPGPDEVIEDVRDLQMLADHEAMIIKDKEGILHFHYGNPARSDKDHPRAFFLPPHAEIAELVWSSGARREKRDLRIKRFDTRPQFMWNDIDCRTQDNVELILETTLFWEVADLLRWSGRQAT